MLLYVPFLPHTDWTAIKRQSTLTLYYTHCNPCIQRKRMKKKSSSKTANCVQKKWWGKKESDTQHCHYLTCFVLCAFPSCSYHNANCTYTIVAHVVLLHFRLHIRTKIHVSCKNSNFSLYFAALMFLFLSFFHSFLLQIHNTCTRTHIHILMVCECALLSHLPCASCENTASRSTKIHLVYYFKLRFC